MARILTRPLFRKGGLSRETGILSGLDTPRRSYAQGSYVPRVGYADGPRLPPISDLEKWKQRIRGTSGGIWDAIKNKLRSTTGTTGTTGTTAQNVAQTGWKGKTKSALDFVRKGAGMARTGIGTLMSNPATLPVAALTATAASPFIAQAAATKQRKKGMFTPEGETYDPETGRITSSQNVDELGFTEQELAGSEAYHPDRPLTPKEMEKARKAKIKELQKVQISARIKRGDPVDEKIAKELGINTTTGEIKTDKKITDSDTDTQITGDMESDLMRAYKEYAPIFEKELGVSPEDTKKQLWMQLAKFGAGLAAQPGGDLVGAIGKAAEKPLEGAGEVVKDVSVAKRQAKLLALQTAIKEGEPGNIGKSLKDIAKAYNFTGKDRLQKAAVIFEKWNRNDSTARAQVNTRYAAQAEKLGLVKDNQNRYIAEANQLETDYPKLIGKFNEKLPKDWEDEENVGGYFVTPQGQFIRVVEQDGEIVRIAMGEEGFEDKPKKKKK